MKKALLLFVLMGLLIITPAFASMPYVHGQAIIDSCVTHPEFICCRSEENLKACISGIIGVDWTVKYYFEEGGKKYGISHSLGFCQKLLDNAVTELDQARATGSCLHLVQDTVSHNWMVPETIRMTWLPNTIAHAMVEEKQNDWLVKQHPEIEAYVKENLDLPGLYPLYEKTLATEIAFSGMNLRKDLAFIQNQIVGSKTGYDPAWESKFNLSTSLYVSFVIIILLLAGFGIKLVFLRDKKVIAYPLIALSLVFAFILAFFLVGFSFADYGFSTFQKYSEPFTSSIPSPSVSQAYALQVQTTKEFMTNPNSINRILDLQEGYGVASGFNSLKLADRWPVMFWNLIGVVLLALVAYLSYLHFTGRKNFWEMFQQ